MNKIQSVVARIDWPVFFLTTFVSVLIGWYISKILETAEGKTNAL